MSGVMTTVEGFWTEWGRLTREEAIQKARQWMQWELDRLARLAAIPDDDLVVYQHQGVHVIRDRIDLPPRDAVSSDGQAAE